MTLAKGTLNFSWNHVFQDSCPNKLIIAFVNSEATGGSEVNGIPVNGVHYSLAITIRLVTVVEVLSNLLMTARKWLNDEGIEISRDDIPGGCALYAFDTTPDFDGNEYLSLKKQGSLRIDAAFNVALPHTVNCIVLAERQRYFEISQSRDVILNSDGY
ncbi:unnamed protein product [Mytilus coruscus]|uniref:Uncharacterized protein n=1 Tax=Mytilus coruscus TaxID=42192 RepID=A0A6J8CVS8_MYTCO|nr:unnamed protein product [Mytilus coruscus]